VWYVNSLYVDMFKYKYIFVSVLTNTCIYVGYIYHYTIFWEGTINGGYVWAGQQTLEFTDVAACIHW
jgi:hypothetical protein